MATESSPAFQRWVGAARAEPVRSGTAENLVAKPPFGLPLRDLATLGAGVPALKCWAILGRPAGLKPACEKPDVRPFRTAMLASRFRILLTPVKNLLLEINFPGASPSCRLLRGTPGESPRPTTASARRGRPGALTGRSLTPTTWGCTAIFPSRNILLVIRNSVCHPPTTVT